MFGSHKRTVLSQDAVAIFVRSGAKLQWRTCQDFATKKKNQNWDDRKIITADNTDNIEFSADNICWTKIQDGEYDIGNAFTDRKIYGKELSQVYRKIL